MIGWNDDRSCGNDNEDDSSHGDGVDIGTVIIIQPY